MNIPIAKHSSGRFFYVVAVALFAVSGICSYGASQGGSAALAMVVGVGLPGLLALASIYMGWSIDHLSVDVSDQGLVIRGPVYGRTITKDKLKLDQAKMVDMGADGDMRLVRRSNGLGLPNLKFGWFTLKNGERAFALVGDATQAIYIPTADGYPLLMTVSDRDGFLKSLSA